MIAVAILANRDFAGLVADAVAHHRAGRLGEAQAGYRAALGISPGYASIMHNLGAIAAAQGDPHSAIMCFDAAIAAEPRYAAAHFNRAAALQALDQPRQAIEAFTRASALDPGCYDAHRALGFLWLAQGERGRALDHFARAYELRRGEDRTDIATRSLTEATRGKLLHDAEQFRFLAGHRRDRQRFEALAKTYETVAKDFSEEPTKLSRNQIAMLGDDYNTAISVFAAPELPGRAVSERRDHATIMRLFQERRAGAVYFDELLTVPALVRLKQYLLESTIWHDFSHIDGFVASYLEDGLACPLLLQVADEIRQTFPQLLADRPLAQAWAFKGLQCEPRWTPTRMTPASASIWLTPTRPTSIQSMEDWPSAAPRRRRSGRSGLDADNAQIARLMARHANDTLYVPYRRTARCSSIPPFHRSDAPQFAQG